MSARFATVVFAAVFLFGCAGNGGTDKTSPAITEAKANVVYFDSDVFDLQLSQSIRSAIPVITVKPASTITIDHIPPRINTWLAAVQRQGGSVNLVAIRESPDGKKEEFIQLLVPIAIEVISGFVKQRIGNGPTGAGGSSQILDYIQKDPLFAGAKNILVTIRYHDRSKEIDDIKFQKL